MRPLNLDEIENRIYSESSAISYSNVDNGEEKITQFFNFLHSEPITKRILQRIAEDFSEIGDKLPKQGSKTFIDHRTKDSIKLLLKTRYEQGAFGYFIIQNLFEFEKKYPHHYTDVVGVWYDRTGKFYENMFDTFKEKFFNPFIELLNWYLNESKTRDEKDYFSKSEIDIINEKLDKILATQEAASQVVFEEIEDLKELVLFLNKKNWKEILKGKVQDTALGVLINNENLAALWNYLSENTPLLK